MSSSMNGHHTFHYDPQTFDDKFYAQLDREIRFLAKSIKKKLQRNDKERKQAFALL